MLIRMGMEKVPNEAKGLPLGQERKRGSIPAVLQCWKTLQKAKSHHASNGLGQRQAKRLIRYQEGWISFLKNNRPSNQRKNTKSSKHMRPKS
ncbi:hypothetical protein AVEN_125883-1 [Araneus ventricosus]|uniref:Uncharacterized protein n=1 Tax=Araneus ventricosus TaxID=182803 RepID=A0A4Y2SKK1_ARAVE|nr:hypothetical protein AVEN_125883-1 [Araneus ventricosus]